MDGFMSRRRLQENIPSGNIENNPESAQEHLEILGLDSNMSETGGESSSFPKTDSTQNPFHFTSMKVRRRANFLRDCNGDYIDVKSDPYLSKILSKYGDTIVLFADKVLRFTGTGKMKLRILLITDLAVYIIDPDCDAVKRRIALASVAKLCISELNDNFFAIVIPSEYDCLMASTRKTEIVNVLLDASKGKSESGLEVFRSNRFEYNAAADMTKEVEFEEIDGNVSTKFRRKENQ